MTWTVCAWASSKSMHNIPVMAKGEERVRAKRREDRSMTISANHKRTRNLIKKMKASQFRISVPGDVTGDPIRMNPMPLYQVSGDTETCIF